MVKYKYKYSKVLDPIKYFKYFSIKYKYKYFCIVTNQVLLITYIQELLNTITVLLLISTPYEKPFLISSLRPENLHNKANILLKQDLPAYLSRQSKSEPLTPQA